MSVPSQHPTPIVTDLDALATPPGFSFAVSRLGSTVVVAVSGALDRAATRAFTPVLRELLVNEGHLAVMVDLRDVAGVDPLAVELFREARGWANSRGGRFWVHGPLVAVADVRGMSTAPVRFQRPADDPGPGD